MELKYIYWYFKKALPKRWCDLVIQEGESKKSVKGLIGGAGKKKVKLTNLDLKKQRNSNIVWLKDQWIYDGVYPYLRLANKNAGWNFQFSYSESCQFTLYSKKQFYDWHQDAWREPYNNPLNKHFHGKIRKLSCSIILNDSTEYKGGGLEFAQNYTGKPNKDRIIKCKEIGQQGDIVIFPSFIRHRVKPVTSGTRKSLVMWTLGDPYV